jgi:hypothetical protein
MSSRSYMLLVLTVLALVGMLSYKKATMSQYGSPMEASQIIEQLYR